MKPDQKVNDCNLVGIDCCVSFQCSSNGISMQWSNLENNFPIDGEANIRTHIQHTATEQIANKLGIVNLLAWPDQLHWVMLWTELNNSKWAKLEIYCT